MSADVTQAIRAKLERLSELDRERDQLMAELNEWRDLIGVADRKRARGKSQQRKRPIRDKSTVWWALKVLRHHGEDQDVDTIIKGINELSGLTVRKSTLVSNLSRYVQAGDTFTRPKPGRYALIEWEEGQK